jgi:DNA-binding MarR family transcriptional regulator
MNHYFDEFFWPGQSIVFALSKARHLLMAEMDVALSGTGVTSSQVGVLLLLSRDKAHTSVALSRLLGIDSGFVTRMLDRLERRGLVHRARNSVDRRVVSLTLTEAGRDVATRIAELAPAMLNRRLAGFTQLEFATLCRLLNKLLDG